MILNPSQAEAVYSALCALNNVSGLSMEVTLPSDIEVRFGEGGGVAVSSRAVGANPERYATQAAFAAAYNLGA